MEFYMKKATQEDVQASQALQGWDASHLLSPTSFM
jgi:hypothetical protein